MLSVASAGVSFAAVETVELPKMILEAYRELREKRHERIRQEARAEGAKQERERLREAGVDIPPDNQASQDAGGTSKTP